MPNLICHNPMICQLNANDYTTSMTGFKYKLSHKRSDKAKWNISDKTQKNI